MPIEFNCPHCLQGYKVADSNVGKRVKCKCCGKPITVPDLSGLSFADDTREVRRPPKRASSTKILPADRPPRKNKAHSETVKLNAARPPKPAAKPPAPPKGKLPGGRLPTNLKERPALPTDAKVPGAARAMPEAPKKRGLNFVLLLGSLALIAGFFLPMFTPDLPTFGETVFAFQLPLVADSIARALNNAGVHTDIELVNVLQSHPDYRLALFVLYLVPVLALYAAVDELRCAGKGKSHWWLRILSALSPAIALGILYFVFRESLQNVNSGLLTGIDRSATLSALGPGTWTLLGGWFFTLLAIVIAPKVKKPKTADVPSGEKPVSRPSPGKPKLPTPRKPE